MVFFETRLENESSLSEDGICCSWFTSGGYVFTQRIVDKNIDEDLPDDSLPRVKRVTIAEIQYVYEDPKNPKFNLFSPAETGQKPYLIVTKIRNFGSADKALLLKAVKFMQLQIKELLNLECDKVCFYQVSLPD